MKLESGMDLLHYRLAEKIGEGGMGVVWKARDTTLDRDVALKVLPGPFLDDPERRARFEREAKLLASLSHANIAGIFGLHEATPSTDGGESLGAPVSFITMELVAGEDLAQRLARGPMPVEQALGVARQIAEALETAHDSGVIHRDLKPANVKLGPEDQVKVLDFGLAKAFEADPSGVDPRASLSPTLTSAGTRAGVLLGTAAYMSPEQARGHVVDKRTDIFAFGAVLYEMLTGKQAFGGETISDSLASILKVEPDWSLLPADTPEAIRRLLGRCMEKRPKQRLRDIGEARIRIEEELGIGATNPSGAWSGPVGASGAVRGAASGVGTTTQPPAGAVAAEAPTAAPARPSRFPWLVAAVAVLVAAASIGALLLSRGAPTPASQVVRMTVALSETAVATNPGAQAVLSPDGTFIVYVAEPDDRIHVRRLDQLEATALLGTEGAAQPFLSPDGRWIGFFAKGKLKKVSVVGGAPLTLCETQNRRGGTWGPDDTIVFSPDTTKGLFRVSAAGGEPEELTTPDKQKNERSHRWPHFLPDGRAVLFTAQDQSTSFDEARIEVLDLETMQRKVVQPGGAHPAYAPTGHLVYMREGTMFAAPFDLDALELESSPVPVLEGISYNPSDGGGRYHFSPAGHLLYLGGGPTLQAATLSWLDREGHRTPALREAKDYSSLRISPDGSKLLTEVSGESTNTDLWLYDFSRDVLTRLTFSEKTDDAGCWSPDGERIYFSSDRHGGSRNVYSKRADGTGEAARLIESEVRQDPNGISPDGRTLVLSQDSPETAWDVLVFDLEQGGEPSVFLDTPYVEGYPTLSPDGRWLAYLSNESGEWQVYVRPFPKAEGKWQVSTDGAEGPPQWSPDGSELFYEHGSDLLVATVSTSGDSFVAGRPRVLVEDALGGNAWSRSWAVHPDGKRFLVTDKDDSEEIDRTHMTLVLNWFDELRERVPD